MKYCISYRQNPDIRAKVDEIRFPVQTLSLAVTYATENPDKRIIIEIPANADKLPSIEKLSKLQESTPNITYEFYELQDLIKYNKATNCGRSYMYHYPITTWAMIQILKFHKVSDILLGEPLLFCLDDIFNYVKEQNIKIRACPHKVRNNLLKDIPTDIGIRHFFVLPQHVHLYEEYIDVLEISDEDDVRERGLIQTYTSGNPYLFPLNLLIENIGTSNPPDFIDNKWVHKRIYCQQKCIKSPTECDYCNKHMKLFEAVKSIEES